jgi:cytochrome P450
MDQALDHGINKFGYFFSIFLHCRYLPTRRNLKVRRLDKLVRTKIMAMMEARVAAKDDATCGGGYGDDLLGLMLEAWSPERQAGSDGTLTTEEVIDECKTFFGAGQETTATLLVWAMFLLSTHPQWQEKVREEVLREFSCDAGGGGGGVVVPNTDVLARLKLVRTSRLSIKTCDASITHHNMRRTDCSGRTHTCSFTWFCSRR